MGILGQRVGNQILVDYGIQNENSHIRVHVCPVVKRVYVYPTECGVAAIQTGKYRKAPGYQKGWSEPTAEGYLVPPKDIEKCVSIELRNGTWKYINFRDGDSTTGKGRKATVMVESMIRAGLLPVPLLPTNVESYTLQVEGQDIIIKNTSMPQHDIAIQVKCDYSGGEKELGGSGNLFLQVAECNPFKRI